MHYKNGTPAKVGDIVIAKSYTGTPYSAIVVHAVAGSDTFNLSLLPFIPNTLLSATASECLLASDAFPADPKPTS